MDSTVAFAGARCLQNEGMYLLTSGYALNRFLPFCHVSDERGCRIKLAAIPSLLVCCPPCTSGILAWLSALLPVCHFPVGRVVLVLDGRQSWQGRLARRLFSSPMSVVHDSDPADYIASALRSPASVRRHWISSLQLTRQEKWVLNRYLQGASAEVQAEEIGLSAKSIYRIRQSGLAKLGMKYINDPSPSRN